MSGFLTLLVTPAALISTIYKSAGVNHYCSLQYILAPTVLNNGNLHAVDASNLFILFI